MLFLCRSFDRKTVKPADVEHAVPPFENWKSEGENWALPTQAEGIGSTRFLQKVKSFLKDRFVAGTQTDRTLAS